MASTLRDRSDRVITIARHPGENQGLARDRITHDGVFASGGAYTDTRRGDAPDVIAFLEVLGDAPFDTSIPESVPSGLTPGGAR